jgi:hypothetical protein
MKLLSRSVEGTREGGREGRRVEEQRDKATDGSKGREEAEDL